VNNTLILPDGWTTSDSLLSESESLSPNSYYYHTILVDVPSSVPEGTYSIISFPQANNTNQTHNASVNIAVTESGSGDDGDDGDDGAGGGGGGGGGGSGSTLTQEESERFFNSEESLELTRGEDQRFVIPLENPYEDAELRNIKVTLEGFTPDYLAYYPARIPRIPINESVNITVDINAPGYFTKGEYDLEFTFEGEVKINETNTIPLRYTKGVKLFILEVSRGDAIEYMKTAQEHLEEMKSLGMEVNQIEELMNPLKDYYDKMEFKLLKGIYEQIEEIYKAASDSNQGINELQISVGEAEKKGILVEETKRLLYLAESSYKRGSYSTALERVKEAKLTLAIETKGQYVKEIMYAIKSDIPRATAGFSSFGVFIGGTSLFIRWRYLKRKIRKSVEEEKLLMELMKATQIEVFEKAKMSMKEYGDAMTQYEDRLNKAIQRKIEYDNKRANLIKFKSKAKRLTEEREQMLNLIRKTQNAYIKKGKYETRVYENMLKSYSDRLSDIEEKLALADAKKAIRKGKI
jgi:hypothetical protein